MSSHHIALNHFRLRHIYVFIYSREEKKEREKTMAGFVLRRMAAKVLYREIDREIACRHVCVRLHDQSRLHILHDQNMRKERARAPARFRLRASLQQQQ